MVTEIKMRKKTQTWSTKKTLQKSENNTTTEFKTIMSFTYKLPTKESNIPICNHLIPVIKISKFSIYKVIVLIIKPCKSYSHIPSAFWMTCYVKFCFIFFYFEVVVKRPIELLNSNSQWSLLEKKIINNKLIKTCNIKHQLNG